MLKAEAIHQQRAVDLELRERNVEAICQWGVMDLEMRKHKASSVMSLSYRLLSMHEYKEKQYIRCTHDELLCIFATGEGLVVMVLFFIYLF